MASSIFDRAINPRVFSDWKHCLAFGLGSGLARKAPGTWGTLAAIPLCCLLWWVLPAWLFALVLVAMSVFGVWLCGAVASELDVHDHSGIVWDEWTGYGIALFALPLQWYWLVLAFLFFRLFDIWKPWPISWCDKNVHGGWGIMLDDILAGIFSCLCLHGLSFFLAAFLTTSTVVADVEPVSAQKPMNFIVILLDDLGLHDTGFMGNDFIETPAIDKLAKDGVVFTQAYANAPNCAPSRAAILSGQYAPRTGVYTMGTGDMGSETERKLQTPKNNMFLPENVYTIAELLHDHGYATASIGKWNLGHGAVRGPEGQGFDLNIAGHRGSVGQSYFAPYSTQLPGVQNAPADEYLTDRLNAEALRFIEQHKAQPFFIYLAHYAPHFPIQAPAETKKKYLEKRQKSCGAEPELTFCEMSDYYPEYAAMVEHVDNGVARLRELLAKDGLDKNTTIVLMSDNGGYPFVRDPNALRGQKSQLYEGGIRVPMVWLVPGNHAGEKSDVPVSGIDLYPTMAALAKINTDNVVLDGKNISPLLFDKKLSDATQVFPQRDLFWYLPGYTTDSTEDQEDGKGSLQISPHEGFTQIPAVAMRRDNWKLIWYYDGTTPELYNIRVDPLERHDQFMVEKKRADAMLQALKQWLLDTGGAVQLPPNPAYRQ